MLHISAENNVKSENEIKNINENFGQKFINLDKKISNLENKFDSLL